MNADPTTEIERDLAIRYLLGTLPEDETDRLELLLLTDGQVSDQFAAAADELVDDYVSGRLARPQRVAFERQLRASGRLRESAAFARALDRLAHEREERATPGDARPETAPVAAWPGRRNRPAASRWTQLAAAASIVLGIGCGWLLWRSEALRQEVLNLETAQRDASVRVAAVEEERESLAELAERLDRELAAERAAAATARERAAELATALEERGRPAPRPPVTASFALSAALRSELGARRLRLPAAAERVRLTLDLGADEGFASYLAVLTGPAGAELWSAGGLAASDGGSAVEVVLPASLLATGRHEVLLYGEPEGAGAGGTPELVGAFEIDLERP